MSLDDYPTPDELQTIEEWHIDNSYEKLMDYVFDIWKYAREGCWESYMEGTKHVYEISTGGWSGNEDIIEALGKNQMFWYFCWWSSRRGGAYEFRIAKP